MLVIARHTHSVEWQGDWEFRFTNPNLLPPNFFANQPGAETTLPSDQVFNLGSGQTVDIMLSTDGCNTFNPFTAGGVGFDQTVVAAVGPAAPGWESLPDTPPNSYVDSLFVKTRVIEPVVPGGTPPNATVHVGNCPPPSGSGGNYDVSVSFDQGACPPPGGIEFDQYLVIEEAPDPESAPQPAAPHWFLLSKGMFCGDPFYGDCQNFSPCCALQWRFLAYGHNFAHPETKLHHKTVPTWFVQTAGFTLINGLCTPVVVFAHEEGNDETKYYQRTQSSLVGGPALFEGEAFMGSDGTFAGARPCLGPGALTPALIEESQSLSTKPLPFLVMEFNTGCTLVGGWDTVIPNLEGKDRIIRGWVLDWGQMNDSLQKTLEDTPVLAGLWSIRFFVPGGRTGEDTIWTRLTDPRNNPELTKISLFFWFRDLNAVTDPPYKRWEGTVNSYKWLQEDELEIEFADSWALYDRPVGNVCTNIEPLGTGRQVGVAFFPNMAIEDVGKIEPILYGHGIGVPCVSIDSGANSSLARDYFSPFIDNGQVTGIVVTDPGLGYTSIPTVTIDPPPAQSPPGITATARAVIQNGKVVEIVMLNQGSKYLNTPPNPPPAVVITGGGGLVQATAQVEGADELEYTIIPGHAPQFTTSGKVWVDGELFSYTGKTTRDIIEGNQEVPVGVLTGVLHAATDDFGHPGIPATAHARGAGILQSQAVYKYSAAGHPIQAIDQVYADDVLVPPFLYGANYNDNGRATLSFTLPPKILYAVAKFIYDNTLWGTNAHVLDIHEQPSQIANNGQQFTGANITNGVPIATFRHIDGMIKQTVFVTFSQFQFSSFGGHFQLWLSDGLIRTIIWDSQTTTTPLPPASSHVEFIGTGDVIYVGMNALSGTIFGNAALIQVAQVNREAYIPAVNTKTGAITAQGLQSANPNVEPKITYNGRGWQDDRNGTFTGESFALVNTTRDVIRHFMNVFLGLPITSFETSQGLDIKMGDIFNVNGPIMSRQFGKYWISRWAFEAACWAKFEAGKLRLSFRDTAFAADAVITSKRLSFMGQKRQAITEEQAPINQIINTINLRYNRDFTMSGNTAYRSLVSVQDGNSQSKYGIKERSNLFQFDFCASPIEETPPTAADIQAATVAQIYLDLYARRRTFLKFRQRLFALSRRYGDHVVIQDRMAPTVAGEVLSVDVAPGGVPQRKFPDFDITLFTIPEGIYMRNVFQKTGNYILMSPADQGQTFSNKGATGTVTFSLPPSEVGMQWGPFFVTDAFYVRVIPIAGESFVTTGQPVGTSAPAVQTAGHAIKSNTPRSILYFECLKAGEFQVLFQEGTWVVE